MEGLLAIPPYMYSTEESTAGRYAFYLACTYVLSNGTVQWGGVLYIPHRHMHSKKESTTGRYAFYLAYTYVLSNGNV